MERARKIGGICLYAGVPLVAIGAVLNLYTPIVGWVLVAIGTVLCLFCGLVELIATGA